MTTDLENRIRASLRDRADDVEPTPELWQAVARRTTRRRAVPYLAWTAAGAAGVLVLTTVVPDLLDSTDRSLTVAPVGEAPAEEGAEGAFVTRIPARYVAGVGPQLVLRSLDGSDEDLFLTATEGGDILSVEVQPGSDAEDLVLAYTERTAAGVTINVAQFHRGWFERMVIAEVPSTGAVEPQAVWSPDGARLAWTLRDAEGAWVAQFATFSDPASPTTGHRLAQLPSPLTGEGPAWVLQDWDVVGDHEEIIATAADGRAEPLVLSITPGATGISTVEALDPGLVEQAPLPRIVDIARTSVVTTLVSRDDVEVSVQSTLADGGHGTRWELAPDEHVSVTGVGGAVLVAGDSYSSLDVNAPDGDDGVWPLGGGEAVAAVTDLPAMQAAAFVLDASATLPNDPGRLDELVPQRAEPAPPVVEDQPGSAASDASPFLAVDTAGAVVLGTADGRTELFGPAVVEGDPVPMDVSVRPGSTIGDLTATVLWATEAGPELGWVRVVDGEVTRDRFDDAYQIGFDADLGHLQVPVWSPDGRHLAWTERAPDGSWRLRTIGWEDGPGTGRTADDNATTSLPLTAGDLELEAWVWGESSADDPSAAGELWFTADRKAQVESYAIRFPIERQADGALAFGESFASYRDAGPQVLDLVAVGERVDLLVRRGDGSFAVEVDGGTTYDVTFPMEGDGTRFDLDAVASGLVVTGRDSGGAYLVGRSDGETRSLMDVGEEGLTAYDHVD